MTGRLPAKTVVWMQISLDGRTQGPNGEFDWPVVGPDAHAHFVETLRHAGLFGGSEVVSALIEKDLVDELQIFVHPVVLGGRAPLFPALDERRNLRLVEGRTFDGSVVCLRYARDQVVVSRSSRSWSR